MGAQVSRCHFLELSVEHNLASMRSLKYSWAFQAQPIEDLNAGRALCGTGFCRGEKSCEALLALLICKVYSEYGQVYVGVVLTLQPCCVPFEALMLMLADDMYYCIFKPPALFFILPRRYIYIAKGYIILSSFAVAIPSFILHQHIASMGLSSIAQFLVPE